MVQGLTSGIVREAVLEQLQGEGLRSVHRRVTVASEPVPAGKRAVLNRGLTEAPEATCHGQQAAPGLGLELLRDRRQGDGNGVHTAQRPWAAGRLAGWGWPTGRTGTRLRLGLSLGRRLGELGGLGGLGGLGLGRRLGGLRLLPLLWNLFRHSQAADFLKRGIQEDAVGSWMGNKYQMSSKRVLKQKHCIWVRHVCEWAEIKAVSKGCGSWTSSRVSRDWLWLNNIYGNGCWCSLFWSNAGVWALMNHIYWRCEDALIYIVVVLGKHCHVIGSAPLPCLCTPVVGRVGGVWKPFKWCISRCIRQKPHPIQSATAACPPSLSWWKQYKCRCQLTMHSEMSEAGRWWGVSFFSLCWCSSAISDTMNMDCSEKSMFCLVTPPPPPFKRTAPPSALVITPRWIVRQLEEKERTHWSDKAIYFNLS